MNDTYNSFTLIENNLRRLSESLRLIGFAMFGATFNLVSSTGYTCRITVIRW